MIKEITPVFVKYIPEEIQEGFLYISLEYTMAIHKCCCGCETEVSTPIDPKFNGWILTNENGIVSLSPSIGNYQIPCKSHYFIKENKVIWC